MSEGLSVINMHQMMMENVAQYGKQEQYQLDTTMY